MAVCKVNYYFPLKKCPYCGKTPIALYGVETGTYTIECDNFYCAEQPSTSFCTKSWLKARLLWDRQKVYKESDFEN
jgi:hypothetical protein